MGDCEGFAEGDAGDAAGGGCESSRSAAAGWVCDEAPCWSGVEPSSLVAMVAGQMMDVHQEEEKGSWPPQFEVLVLTPFTPRRDTSSTHGARLHQDPLET